MNINLKSLIMGKKKIIDRVVMGIAILAIIFSAYFYYKWNMAKKTPEAIIQKETSELLSKVSKLMVLPTGESPTIATVSDPDSLKDQSFFINAEKGDKVLIYAQAKKAILYSVTLDKIIDVAPLSVDSQQKSSTSSVVAPDSSTQKKQ